MGGPCPPFTTSPLPWEVLGDVTGADVLFPRSVDVHRIYSNVPVSSPVIGDIGYVGYEQTTTPPPGVEGEKILYVGVPAAIVPKEAGRSKGPLAADLMYKPTWSITIPASAVPMYGIRDRDILVDDEGYRYSVTAAGYSALAWSLECIRLEA